MTSVAGCILAGGRSSRMGKDKGGVLLGGQPLVAHVVDRLRPQVTSLAINSHAGALTGLAHDIPLVPDTVAGQLGPMAGVLAAMRHAASIGERHIITVPVDAPFFPLDLVARLEAAAPDPSTIAVAASDGVLHPVFCLWPADLADALEHWLMTDAKRRVRDFIFAHSAVKVDFPLIETVAGRFDPFFNINMPESLAIAQVWRAVLDEGSGA